MTISRRGMTLIEIMIVVVLLSILVMVLIPQFNDASGDAVESTALRNLQGLRKQIDLYKVEHSGIPPTGLDLLAVRTNRLGATGADAATYPLGPYLLEFPENPLGGGKEWTLIASYPPAAPVAGPFGWLYHRASGTVYLNHADYLDR